MKQVLAIGCLLAVGLSACQGQSAAKDPSKLQESTAAPGRSAMELRSDAITPGGLIPKNYTCDGDNISPPLSWTNVPDSAKSLALIVDDPDAPAKVWVHWVVYNIPPHDLALPQNFGREAMLGNGIRQGTNDFRQTGYDGPCPPSGTHRYQFKLYALDETLALQPNASKDDVVKAMQGHVLEQVTLEGNYHH